MTSGGTASASGASAAARLARTLRVLGRDLGPVVQVTLPALLRHPVWTGAVAFGGGRGAVVVPGFGGADWSMAVLRRWLARCGYRAVGGGLAMNLGCTADLVDRLERRAEALARATGGPVVLVGHSRGGLLCRMLAVRRPDLVAGLAMLGSPVLDPLDLRGAAGPVLRVLVRLSQAGVRGLLDDACLTGDCRDATAVGLSAPLRVPALAVFSQDDRVVRWDACRDPSAEWVEVGSSHTGMGTDPDLYAALLDRLHRWAAA